MPYDSVHDTRGLLCDTDLPGGRQTRGHERSIEALEEPDRPDPKGIPEAGKPALLDPEHRKGIPGSLAYPPSPYRDPGDGRHPGGSLEPRRNLHRKAEEKQILR